MLYEKDLAVEESKIAKALRLVTEGKTRYAAAKEVGLPPGSVYRELKKRRLLADGLCPSCGGPVDEAGKHVEK